MKNTNLKSRIRILLTVGVILLFNSCYPEDTPIPDVPVDNYIDLLDPYYSGTSFEATYDYDGNIIGNYGVVVYFDGYDYYAFDRMCPYECSLSCLVTDMGDGTVICPCCRSRYMITSAHSSNLNGPSTNRLKRYYTEVTEDDFLHIFY